MPARYLHTATPIEQSLNHLNTSQRQAVRYIDGPCLILAGAGSGKTSVITHKIAHLIKACGLAPQHIAAVTFTNKAAREMKERATALLRGTPAKGLIVSTFHLLGLRILRKEYTRLGYRAGFSIFDGEDCRALLKDILFKQSDLDNDHLDRLLNQISRWKNDLVAPEQAILSAHSTGEQTLALMYQRYTQALRAYNALDFDDLITLPVTLLQQQLEVQASWQRKIRYLLVDEYQDTNQSQYQLVKLLVGDRGAFTVVGDDDQSIYAWRGANPQNLTQLQADFPNLAVIKLEQNYRSTNRILKVANTLIQCNPHQFEKSLWSENGIGELVRIIRCTNEETEAERVATEVLHLRIGRRMKFRDFAVLYRGNHQAKLLEMKFQQHQIPYVISGGTSFFARSEIKDIMAYLRLLVNPHDDSAFLRIVNTPRRQIGTTTLESLTNYATARQTSLYSAATELGLQQQLSPQALARLQGFIQLMETTSKACAEGDAMTSLWELLDSIDYEGWLHQNASNTKVAENRFNNVRFLLDSIAGQLRSSRNVTTVGDAISEDAIDEDAGSGLESVIAKLLLQDLLERQEEEDITDRVQLMTLHAAKGLEFPFVFIIGVEEELLPHATSITEGNIEEERRLAYVGITRAQQSLTLTLAEKRKKYGEVVATTPSRFIDELPKNDLLLEGFSDESPGNNKAKANETLSNLRDLLA